MIYDSDGNVQAVSGSLDSEKVLSTAAPSRGPSSVFSNNLSSLFALSGDSVSVEPQSALGLWVAGEIRESKSHWPRCSQTSIENNGESFDVRFETLTGTAGLAGYALQLERPQSVASLTYGMEESAREAPEEATLITRQQWHDIKNELGGLKLYATFLRRRHSGSEDLEVVDKLLNGINGLIDHLARIRRGETR